MLQTRLLKGEWAAIRAELRRYRAITERDAPAGFASVANRPLRDLQLKRWARLALLLLLTRGQLATD